MTDAERSTSRGREYQSTGRGGLGNIRQSSASRDARPNSGPDDFSPTRGREGHVSHTDKIYSTGRGGAGNIRSPSRDALKPSPAGEDTYEENVIREYNASHEDAPHSSGRGGLGNMSRSRSRDQHSATPVHSSGRGGAGNIRPGTGATEAEDEEERRKLAVHHGGIHSTGRGGSANLTSATEPSVEHPHRIHHAHEYESTGRGGSGNIVQDRHTPTSHS